MKPFRRAGVAAASADMWTPFAARPAGSPKIITMKADDSQCELILTRLQATPGEWVSMPELCQISGSYNVHTRIDQIRHERGLRIENDIRRKPRDRRQYSYYRIPAPITNTNNQ